MALTQFRLPKKQHSAHQSQAVRADTLTGLSAEKSERNFKAAAAVASPQARQQRMLQCKDNIRNQWEPWKQTGLSKESKKVSDTGVVVVHIYRPGCGTQRQDCHKFKAS